MGIKGADNNTDDDIRIVGNNEIEDVQWLCSLPESQLDLLIGLKKMVNQRAKLIGHDSLANHFNLKVLRSLSYTMMEHLKEQMKDSSVELGFPESSKILDKCKLLQLDVEKSFSSMSSEELWPYICPDIKKKRTSDMFDETESLNKRHKFGQ